MNGYWPVATWRAVLAADERARQQLIIVTSWFDELLARFAADGSAKKWCAARRNGGIGYICRSQLTFTIRLRALGVLPLRIGSRSLYTTYTNDNGRNSQLKRAFSVPRLSDVLYW